MWKYIESTFGAPNGTSHTATWRNTKFSFVKLRALPWEEIRIWSLLDLNIRIFKEDKLSNTRNIWYKNRPSAIYTSRNRLNVTHTRMRTSMLLLTLCMLHTRYLTQKERPLYLLGHYTVCSPMKINRRFEGDDASIFGNEENASVKQTELLYSGFLLGFPQL